MKIINARLRGRYGLYSISVENGVFTSVEIQAGSFLPEHGVVDANSKLVCSPFVEPHIHLDAAMTAGEPNWNLSGTLFEGIQRWAERKPMLNEADIRRRALATIELLVSMRIPAKMNTHSGRT